MSWQKCTKSHSANTYLAKFPGISIQCLILLVLAQPPATYRQPHTYPEFQQSRLFKPPPISDPNALIRQQHTTVESYHLRQDVANNESQPALQTANRKRNSVVGITKEMMDKEPETSSTNEQEVPISLKKSTTECRSSGLLVPVRRGDGHPRSSRAQDSDDFCDEFSDQYY
jgi:hypothetical protein